ncbi:MAG: hypothetical protein P8X90_32025 [Desulfobacterales bacterium]
MLVQKFLDILPQPDGASCGPTCLHAIYHYFDDDIPLQQVIAEVTALEGGGTLAVYLACHALQRGFKATIISYNLQIFDPTWAAASSRGIAEKLRLQLAYKKHLPGFEEATSAYLDFLRLGGRLQFKVLTTALIRGYLKRSIPLLSGLSATFLYGTARECYDGNKLVYDDIRGVSTGHFVVLAGYNREQRTVLVADPLLPNPVSSGQHYHVNISRLMCAIMLGTLTYDADLLIVEPRKIKSQQHPQTYLNRPPTKGIKRLP